MEHTHTESLTHIKQVQWLQLQKQLRYLDRHSPYYREMFKKNDIDITTIDTYAGFNKIPLTSKEDLQLYNDKFISIPKEDIIDHVTTSGTLGKPVSLMLNEADLQRLTFNEYESFKMAGVKKADVVQITTTLDRRFMAGLAYFLGLRKLGAGIVRTGSGFPQMQWDSIERFNPKYLVCVPSFLLKMTEYAINHNIDFKNSSVKAAICIGEPVRNVEFELNSLGRRIRELWDIELYSTYASTEMATAFTECYAHKGNHVQPELIYPEILDQAGVHVIPGEVGELVITTLQSETMPLLRFATGDMLTYNEEPCSCGRNTMRLSPVLGRKNQMIKLKGTSLYPQNIIEVMNQVKGIDDFIIEARRGELGIDKVTVKIPEGISFETLNELYDHMRAKLQVAPEIEAVSLAQIEALKFPGESRKPQVFRDFRREE